MKPFLYRVAEIFYNNHGSNINAFTFVFPNRRAGLFFRKYLSQLIDKPLFAPDIITINECFASASQLQQADRIQLLFRLYDIYKNRSGSNESFDTFAYWGEMLLSDFNEVDRYMVDAKQLFTNVTELKETGDMFDYLTENQIKAIKQFWTDFQLQISGNAQKENDKSNIREFLEIWKVLYHIYQQISEDLLKENTGTDGMISRYVAEKCKRNEDIAEWEGRRFVFVGFNALNPCEKELMKYLQKRGQADFYRDYEADCLRDPDNPSSRYYDENRMLLPSQHEPQKYYIPLAEKEFVLISVPSVTGQASEAAKILNELNEGENTDWLKTAVVLPDENLLMPVLNLIPQHIEKVNVTMGYPLTLTPLTSFVESLYELQKRKRTRDGVSEFYFRNVNAVLQHQYLKPLCGGEVEKIAGGIIDKRLIYAGSDIFGHHDLLKSIFTMIDIAQDFPLYLLTVLEKMHDAWLIIDAESESTMPVSNFINLYYNSVNRLVDVMTEFQHIESISFDTIMRIIRQLVSGISVPFTGEPLEGLQVMGVLETRGLDFENLIITSFNEGIFPSKSFSQSFIPHSLRKSFGLPVYEYQDAIMSYNFYRLLQRAKRVYFIYDSRSEGVNTGEVSRFLYQLQYHYNLNVKRRNIHFDLRFNSPQSIQIEKTAEVQQKLSRFLQQTEHAPKLSASSVNTYVNCPLSFYLGTIEKLREIKEITELPGDDVFGTVFHKVMELLYEPLKGKLVTDQILNAFISDAAKLKKTIYQAIAVEYLKINYSDNYTPDGNLLLVSEVLYKYVVNTLKTDSRYAPFTYIDSEKHFSMQIQTSYGLVNVTGFIDRIDEKEGKIRILDYKTGKEKREFKGLDTVFSHTEKERNSYVLQTMLYGLYYSSLNTGKIIEPGLYFMRKTYNEEKFDTQLVCKDSNGTENVADFSSWKEDYTRQFTNCLEEIFNPDIPFFQTTEPDNCKYCNFKSICSRQ